MAVPSNSAFRKAAARVCQATKVPGGTHLAAPSVSAKLTLYPISVPSTDRLGSLKSDPLTDREDLRQERSIDLSALMG